MPPLDRQSPEYKERKRRYAAQYRLDHPEYAAQYRANHKVQARASARERAPETKAKRRVAFTKLGCVVYRWDDPLTSTTTYVGSGTIRRPRQHVSRSKWWKPELQLTQEPARSEWHAKELEAQWGQKYKPTANIEGNRR